MGGDLMFSKSNSSLLGYDMTQKTMSWSRMEIKRHRWKLTTFSQWLQNAHYFHRKFWRVTPQTSTVYYLPDCDISQNLRSLHCSGGVWNKVFIIYQNYSLYIPHADFLWTISI